MKNFNFFCFILFSCQYLLAQSEIYLGGNGRGDYLSSYVGYLSGPIVFSSIEFSSQPQTVVLSNSSFSITIRVLDQFGNTITTFNDQIVLSFNNNPSSSVLSGTTSLNANLGVSVFSGLSINNIGSGYSLSATSGSLQATSSFFDVLNIYLGGIGRGDIMQASTSQLNSEHIWLGPSSAGNNNFSNVANWQLGYVPNMGNIKVDNTSTRDLELVANVSFDTLFFLNNTSTKAVLGAFNFKLKHYSASTDRHLFKTNGLGSMVIPSFNNGKTLKFPVGNSDYNPVTITNMNTSADSIGVRVSDAVLMEAISGAPVTTSNIQRTWFIAKNNANTSGVNFVYEWNTTQQTGAMSGYYLNHYTGTDWEVAAISNYETPVYNGNSVSLAVNGYSGGFSPFTFGDSPVSALPIELVRFDAILQNRIVDLTWQTASEHNNDFFTVERSADIFNFEPIANMDGAGNSTELLNYATQDLHPLNGVSYYRLKQTDFDGAFEYSDLRVVILGEIDELLVFPNPSNTGLINFQNPVDIGEMAIYSSEGKLVFKEIVGNTLQVRLNPGVYLVRYEVAGFLKTKKIVITN